MTGNHRTDAGRDGLPGPNAADVSLRPTGDRRMKPGRLVPAAILVVGLLVALFSGATDHISLDTLAAHREAMTAWVAQNGILAGALYAGLVTAVAAFSIPAIAVMNVSAGFLFGPLVGTAVAAIGQTIGGTVVFLAARHAFADSLRGRLGPAITRMEDGFRRNALSYMLMVRFMPMFPAWLVNLVPGVLGVRVSTFVLGTALGVIPCTFVFASVGNGLGAVIDRGDRPSLSIFLEPHILLPFVGLAAIAMLPILLGHLRGRNGPPGTK